MGDQGELCYCLGMSIKRDIEAKVLTINQNAYLESILKWFGISDCKPFSTPMEAGKKFEKLADEENAVNTRNYQTPIGLLIYGSIATRPELLSSVGALTEFMSNPGNNIGLD